MRDALHALKYHGLRPASRRLGRLLAYAIAQLAEVAPAEMLVVPVPLHRSKQTGRGFNQARLLATSALASLRETHPAWRLTMASDSLVRLRATDSQAGLTPRQRRLNVRGAFRVSDPRAVTGRHILVIDDILTTGATARAAAQALLNAGAETVWVATLARARMTNARPLSFAASYSAAESFEDADRQLPGSLPESGPASLRQPASMYSQDQRSF